MTQFSRRSFLKASAVTGLAVPFMGTSLLRADANSKLNIAAVGVGGKGWSDLTSIAASPYANIVALCDIDETKSHLGRAAEKYPKAKTFSDWRKLLEEKNIDAVQVSTPDHMHAPISLAAMALGKHVYCQKPLTHTVFESREMTKAAKKAKVITQMGNQIHSHQAYRTATQIVHDGLIGKVKEVHSWQSGQPTWRKVNDRPAGSASVPKEVHWDLWLGVAPERPYQPEIYHPFNWRNFQDFGVGQIGDFACHILDPVFTSLKLTAPTSIVGKSGEFNKEIWPHNSNLKYVFPGTQYTAGSTLNLDWYDGTGVKPTNEVLGLPASVALPAAGSALIGEKGTLIIPHVAMPRLYPTEQFEKVNVPQVEARDHYTSWVAACVGKDKATADFDYAGPLTEAVLLGTIAIRFPGEKLEWDAKGLKFSNSAEASKWLTKPYRRGWELTKV